MEKVGSRNDLTKERKDSLFALSLSFFSFPFFGGWVGGFGDGDGIATRKLG